MNHEVRRSRTAFFIVGVFVPIVIIAITAAIAFAWLPELPDPIATHWGSDGADGYGPRWMAVALPLGVGGGLIALMGVMGAFGHRMPQSSTKPPVASWGPVSRFLGAMSLGLALMIAVMSLSTAGIQRGLAEASLAPDIGGWTLVSVGLLIVGSVAGWFLQPRSPERPVATGAPVTAMTLAPAQRAAWFGTAAMARGGRMTLLVLLLILFATTAFTVAGGGPSGWVLVALSIVMIVLIGSTLVFRVRVNGTGLRVRSLLGWPDTRIAAADIVNVEVVEINPMAEFGGWGWRIGVDGRRGVVLRTGEALQVTDSRGKVFVVTVDGARDAASVLEAVRERANHDDPHPDRSRP
ncbi:DUF1648 domain-containing protein [Microbacterium sp.]|uniref:DUF1648 domain-containing protein n=1 Tax=Microbacterium sp. TaxID=51671 RepID=UPI0026172E41|nr:DUF1648 domain-containing protein [Microbacterium sp.]